MAIYVGESLRVVAEHSSWRVEERRIAAESGKERWEPVGYYTQLHMAFALGIVENQELKAAGLVDDVVTTHDFLRTMHSLALGMGTTIRSVLEYAWCDVARRWNALGVEGVPANPREWSEEQTNAVHSAMQGDTPVLSILDCIAGLQTWDRLLKRIEDK